MLWFLLIVALSRGQPTLNEVHISLRRRDAARALFLKAMQHVDSVLQAHRVDSSIRVAVVPLDYFQDARSLKAFERPGILVRQALLRKIERVTDGSLHILGERSEISE